MLDQNPQQRLLTVDDLLNIIPISRPTVSRLIKSGKLGRLRVGRRIFFRPAEVEAFLQVCHE
jgi:excisionase family DNA binding protein